MKGCVSSTYPLGDFPPGLDTLLSGEDKRFMGSSPFEFGSANLDANGELGRFRGSPGKKIRWTITIYILNF